MGQDCPQGQPNGVGLPHQGHSQPEPQGAPWVSWSTLGHPAAAPQRRRRGCRRLSRKETPPDTIARRPGPIGACSDAELADHIRRHIAASRLHGEGYPVTLTCPECEGVLTEVRDARPLRYRCQIGHAYTADTLLASHDQHVNNAAKIALRLVDEHVGLLTRMAGDAEKRGHRGAGQAFEERAAEYREAADVLRKALWQSEPKLPLQAPRKKIAPQP